LLQELPRRVVDRGYVVRVEGVTQPEGVGEGAEAGERGVVPRVVEKQPPAGEVQEQHATSEGRKPKPLRTGQDLRPACHLCLPPAVVACDSREGPPVGSFRSEG